MDYSPENEVSYFYLARIDKKAVNKPKCETLKYGTE